MKKKFTLSVCCIIAILAFSYFFTFSKQKPLYAIFDFFKEKKEALNFRSLNIDTEKNLEINTIGLPLLASGSGQIDKLTVQQILTLLPDHVNKLFILDLREEPHGFLNELPISWTDGVNNYGNLNKKMADIINTEKILLHQALQQGHLTIRFKGQDPFVLSVYKVETEEEFIKKIGCHYIRFPVTDHCKPKDHIIDDFIKFFKTLQGDEWLHFHCRLGKGRTTAFLTLLDIMKNAHKVSLETIIERQIKIGHLHFKKLENKKEERRRTIGERIKFIQEFYKYCLEEPNFEKSWSSWKQRQ